MSTEIEVAEISLGNRGDQAAHGFKGLGEDSAFWTGTADYEQGDSKVRFRARDYGQYPWGKTTKGGAADADNDALKDVTQALGMART